MPTRHSQRGAQLATFMVVVVLAVIAAAAGFWFGTHQPPQGLFSTQQPQASKAGSSGPIAAVPDTSAARIASGGQTASGGRKILYWHDPMYPNQRFDKPGKSPFMDMELVPVYADNGSEDATVSIDPRVVQNLGVRSVAAKEGTLESGFTAVGTVTVNERSIIAVQSRSPGYIESLHVRAQYDPVKPGQPLVGLYVPDWLAAEEDLLTLNATTQPGAKELADAARQRLQLLGVPAAEIARVEREKRPSARVTMTAPTAGIVWEIGAREGQSVTPGTTLFKLAPLATVWVNADVPEAQAALVHPGGPVEAHAAGYPDHTFKGHVNYFLPELNAATRTVRARIELTNPGDMLKPGMFVTLNFGGETKKASVVVPSEAVIRTGKRNVVILDLGNGKFAPSDVEVGRDSGDMTEIRKGLKAGQRVVASGQFLIDSEASLKGALTRLESQASQGTTTKTAAAEGPTDQPTKDTSATTHKAHGEVRTVGDEVVIKHDAIPSAGMGAMTMAYKAPKKGLPKNVKPGTEVNFEFVLTPQGDMQLTSITPVSSAAPGTKK